MSATHSNTVPNFITAGSPKALRVLMFKVNSGVNGFVKFYDISSYVDKRGKTRWIAWYNERLEDIEEL